MTLQNEAFILIGRNVVAKISPCVVDFIGKPITRKLG